MLPPSEPAGTERSLLLPTGAEFEPGDFKQRLTDEYKILQDKIDKIGSFRFTIKGWSVTAVLAASAAGGSATSLTTVLTISLGLVVMILFFFSWELEQVKLSRLFGQRARKLESAFIRLDRDHGRSKRAPFPVPYTASEIALRGSRRHLAESPSFRERFTDRWRVWRQAHIRFYVVLFCLAFVPPLLHHSDIRRAWISLEKSPNSISSKPPTKASVTSK